jgi:predicted metalloenzyme YecM
MGDQIKNIIGDPQIFLDQIFAMIDDIDLDVDHFEMDHICYRVASNLEYLEKKNALASHGTLLIESMVSGRLISTFKLHEPIVYKNRKVYLLELPAPKASHAYKSGLEHVEFVTKVPLQKIVDRYPQYSFLTFGIHKKINADITLKLGEYCIRFHNQSLLDVINLEKKMAGKN